MVTVSNGTTSFSLAIAPPNLFSAETAQNALAGLSIGLVIVSAMLVGSAFDFHRVAWIAVATAALSTVYMLSRMRRSGSIVVSGSALTLPSRLVGRPSSPIDLRKIRSVLVARRGLIPYLLIGEDNRITGVPASRLQGPDALAHLQAQLQAALASLADGEVMAAQMQARNAFGDSLGKVVPIASRCAVAMVVVLGVSFGLRAPGAGYLALLDFGANAPVLVRHGEWFRLVLASFLHPTPFETVTAALGFSFFGAKLERLAGWHHLVILTMVSSAAGHAAGAYSLGPVSPGILYTGVLPGIAGLGGALTVIHRRFGKFLPASEQLRGNAATSLMWMLVFLAALDTRSKLLVTAGLLAGGIYGLILCHGKRFPDALQSARWFTREALLACGATVAAAFLAILLHGSDPAIRMRGHVLVLRGLAANPQSDAITSARIARAVADDRYESGPTLRAARLLAARTQRLPWRYPEAARIAHEAVAILDARLNSAEPPQDLDAALFWPPEPEPANFDALLQELGARLIPVVFGGEGMPSMPSIGLSHGTIKVASAETVASGARLYILVRDRNNTIAGMIFIVLPPGFSGHETLPLPTSFTRPSTSAPPPLWTDSETRLVPVVFDMRDCACAGELMGPSFYPAPERAVE